MISGAMFFGQAVDVDGPAPFFVVPLSQHLDSGKLAIKVHRSLYKIRRKCLLHGIVDRSMWIMRQAELKDMDGELYT